MLRSVCRGQHFWKCHASSKVGWGGAGWGSKAELADRRVSSHDGASRQGPRGSDPPRKGTEDFCQVRVRVSLRVLRRGLLPSVQVLALRECHGPAGTPFPYLTEDVFLPTANPFRHFHRRSPRIRSFGRSVNRRGSTSTWRRTRWYCQTSRTRDRETKARKVICIFTHYIPNKEWLGLAPLTPRCPAGRTREGRSWASRAETRERGREKWVDGSAPHPACRHLRRGLT